MLAHWALNPPLGSILNLYGRPTNNTFLKKTLVVKRLVINVPWVIVTDNVDDTMPVELNTRK